MKGAGRGGRGEERGGGPSDPTNSGREGLASRLLAPSLGPRPSALHPRRETMESAGPGPGGGGARRGLGGGVVMYRLPYLARITPGEEGGAGEGVFSTLPSPGK